MADTKKKAQTQVQQIKNNPEILQSSDLKKHIGRALPWCFLLFVFALPFSIALTHVALGLWLLVWLLSLWQGQTYWKKTPLDGAILVFLATDLLTGLAGINPARSLVHFVSQWHVAIYMLVVNTVTDRRWLIRTLGVLFIVTGLNASYGLAQHFTRAFYFLQTEEFMYPFRTGSELGTFGHSMTFADQIMLVMLIGVALMLWRMEILMTRWWSLPVIIAFAAWVLSYVRNAWVGGLAGLIVLALMKGKRAAIAIGLAVIVLATLISFLDPVFINRIKSIVNPTKFSNVERIYMWEVSFEMLKVSPVLGVGPGNYSKASEPYRERYGVISKSSPHNNLLLQVTEKGLVGLGAFIYLWYVFFRESWRGWRTASDDLSKALAAGSIAALVGFHVAGLFQSTFADSEVRMMMWLIVGFSMLVRTGSLCGADKSKDHTIAPGSA